MASSSEQSYTDISPPPSSHSSDAESCSEPEEQDQADESDGVVSEEGGVDDCEDDDSEEVDEVDEVDGISKSYEKLQLNPSASPYSEQDTADSISESDEVNDDEMNDIEVVDLFLKKLRMPDRGPWYVGRWKTVMEEIMYHCGLLKDISKTAHQYKYEHLRLLWGIYNRLYSVVCFLGMYALKTDPIADDIQFTPLFRIYLIMSSLLTVIIKKSLINGEYIKSSLEDIKYCMLNGLVMTEKDISISLFSMNELMLSIKKVDSVWRSLPGSKDLVEYIFALEVRAAFFVCNCYPDTYHDVPDYRIPVKNIGGVTYYACTKEVTFELAYSFMGFRRELNSLQMPFRSTDTIKVNYDEVDHVYAVLKTEAAKIVSVDVDQAIRNPYRDHIVPPQLTYRYIYNHSNESTISGESVYAWCDDAATWKAICKISDMSIVKIFTKPLTTTTFDETEEDELVDNRDPLLMKNALYYMFNILIQQDTQLKTQELIVDTSKLATATPEEMNEIAEKSVQFPLIVFSFNDIGVFWNKKIFIFGCEPYSYITALWAWSKIIAVHYHCIRAHPIKISVHKLCQRLLGKYFPKSSKKTRKQSAEPSASMHLWGDYLTK